MKALRITERFIDGTWRKVEEPSPVRCWDDGFGPVWVLRDTMGVQGFVRARSWEEAWECCEDAILPDASLELVKACREAGDPEDELPEGFGWRPSGPTGDLKSPIYFEDLNGQDLSLATKELLGDLGYRVVLGEEGGAS